MKQNILAIFLATLWITFSEFVRNELLLRQYWVDHFTAIGLTFETLPIHGLLWVVWSILLACILFRLLQVVSFKEATIITWLAAFVMMWIVIFNLQTLPMYLLYFAIPLSLLEVWIAGIIIKKMLQKKT